MIAEKIAADITSRPVMLKWSLVIMDRLYYNVKSISGEPAVSIEEASAFISAYFIFGFYFLDQPILGEEQELNGFFFAFNPF